MQLKTMLRLATVLFMVFGLLLSAAPRGYAQEEPGPVPSETEIETADETPVEAPVAEVTPEPVVDPALVGLEFTEESESDATEEVEPPAVESTTEPSPNSSEVPIPGEPTVEATGEASEAAAAQSEQLGELQTQGVEVQGQMFLRALDDQGDPVIGTVCFTEFTDAGGGTPGVEVNTSCGTADVNDGQFFSANRAPGAYVVSITTTPNGYSTPDNALYSIVAGQGTIVELIFPITGGPDVGSILVTKTDDADPANSLAGACFIVRLNNNGQFGESLTTQVCDSDDGSDDGQILIENVLAGEVFLDETIVPAEHLGIDPMPLTVVIGEQLEVQVVNTFIGAKGQLDITAEDEQGDPIEGVCVAIYEDAGGGALGALINGGVGLCSNSGGIVLNGSSNPGNYVAVNVVAPPGFGTPPDQSFTIVSNQVTTVAFVLEEVDPTTPGTLVISKVDQAQQPLAGACFEIYADEAGDRGELLVAETCDDDDGSADGAITIDGIPPGDVLLAESVAPVDFQIGLDREITVVPGQRQFATVTNSPAPEQSFFVLTAEDESGDPVEGACFEVYVDAGGGQLGELIVGGTSLCSDATGHVLSRNQGPGNYIAFNVVAPAGFGTPDDKPFTIGEREEVPVPVVFVEVSPDTPGRIVALKIDNLQNSLAGACFQVFEDIAGDRGDPLSDEVCDDDDGFNDGRISIDQLPPGSVLLAETVAPEDFKIGGDIDATVVAGQRSFYKVTNFPRPEQSSFVLTAEDENGDPVEGACFEVYEDAGGGTLGELLTGGTDMCSVESGFVLNRIQDPGNYIIVNVVAPAGFGTPDDKLFTVGEREEVPVAVVLVEVSPDTPGRIVVLKFDNFQNSLAGACFRVFDDVAGNRGEPLSDEVCDNDDGSNDGRISIDDIPPGSVLIAETVAPEDYTIGGDVAVTVVAGQRSFVKVTNAPSPEQSFFVLTAEDENGDPVEGACFEVYEDAGGGVLGELIVGGTELCSDEDGHVLSRNQDAGNYIVVNVVAPDGFGTPADKRFTVEERDEELVPVVLQEVGPNTPGRLIVTKQDNNQLPLAGACFEVFEDDDGEPGDEVGDRVCDDDDGIDDGRITIDDLAPGDYWLVEAISPPGFVRLIDVEFTIKPGQVTRLTVRNFPGSDESQFVLTAEDEEGDPLEGACFEVYEDLGNGELGELIVGGTDLCSDEDGHVLSRNQDPGSFVAVVVTTPDGFETPANTRFEVNERETTQVNVIFSKTDSEVDDGKDDDEEDEDDEVTALPNTGVTQGSDPWNTGLMALLATLFLLPGFGLRLAQNKNRRR